VKKTVSQQCAVVQNGPVVQVNHRTAGQRLRPVDPAKERKTEALRIRLTPEQHESLSAAAAGDGVGICSFARSAAIRAAGLIPSPAPKPKPDAHARALATWTGALGAVANLLNQLAKDRHAGFDAPQLAVDEARDELKKLRELVLKFHAGDGQP
jgi:hypothetical protein